MLHLGDCLDVMRTMPDNSVDLVLTDPPYGLAFMGKKWDYDVPSVEVWAEALRVLKPGGHLLAFAGTRTQHRMACRIEDAGFEIRDMLAWVYGSGFPKSLDVSKAIDKAAGAEREVVGERDTYTGSNKDANTFMASPRMMAVTAPATDAAREWDGWGTALKPALEPITMARKPLIGTVAANVLEHGTGGLNIDECRVGTEIWKRPGSNAIAGIYGDFKNDKQRTATGRWPANLLHDGSEEVVEMFPQAGGGFGKRGDRKGATVGNYGMGATMETVGYGDSGSAARFFASFPLDAEKERAAEDSDLEQETNCRIKYCAKASKRERDAGLEGMEKRAAGALNMRTDAHSIANNMNTAPRSNHHPTVKPIALMEYLVKLASREGQTVLDPFMGSGTTGIACANLNRKFIGIERDPEYFKIAEARIDNATSLF